MAMKNGTANVNNSWLSFENKVFEGHVHILSCLFCSDGLSLFVIQAYKFSVGLRSHPEAEADWVAFLGICLGCS